MQNNQQDQGQLSQTFLLHPELTPPISSIHLSSSPPRQLCSVPQWCYFCWEPAPAGPAGLSLADRGRHRAAAPASTGPAAEGGPSLMSLRAPHTEPAGMIYWAWSVGRWQCWRLREWDEFFRCSHQLTDKLSSIYLRSNIPIYSRSRRDSRKNSISIFWLTHISSDDPAANIEFHPKTKPKNHETLKFN